MKKHALSVLAATIAASTLLTGLTTTTAFANTGNNTAQHVAVATASRYSINDLKNVKVVWTFFSGPEAQQQHVVDNFNYRNPGPYVMPQGDTHAGVKNLPTGWRTEAEATLGQVIWHVYAPDNSLIISYTVRRTTEIEGSDKIAQIKMTVNGEPYAKWDPLNKTDYDLRSEYPNGATVRFYNLPAGWTVQFTNDDDSTGGVFKGGKLTGSNAPIASDLYLILGATYDKYPQDPATPEGMTPVYRLYNPHSGLHHYTTSLTERNHLIDVGWNYESIAFNQPNTGTPVYRAYNPYNGNHHWTASYYEYTVITTKQGWRPEGVAWYQDDSGTKPVYRAYNPRNGEHLYTLNGNEYKIITTKQGWRGEGIAWKTR
ncbi:hypothetical protein JS533_001510 [Bifidobacterium amazonense]|uniref:DUF5648 domain-containing protein n=1 Tax=Bifidobacterium amazonense TaxID=2809027 RepID=A0ABS9VSA3_9BIFI|nr:hypothetical protein [Bifidobacterium amazonense]MCH9274966.1 hypothetical protein [Bifidobacterium amazonense]